MDTADVLASQRQDHILRQVRGQGAVRVADLTTELNVSDMTIRRDIAELASHGLVRKVHGGAVTAHATSFEPDFAEKTGIETARKRAIAMMAAGLVTPDSAIAIGAGSTTAMFAAELAATATRPLTVVTNSLPVADLLYQDPHIETILTGGCRTRSNALVGPLAVAALAELRVDQVFLGAHGVDAQAGLTTPNIEEAATNQAMIAGAGHVVVLADHTKWNITGLRVFARLDEVDVLVTDADLPPALRSEAAGLVTQLLIAT